MLPKHQRQQKEASIAASYAFTHTSSVAQWLAQRTPGPAQSRLIAERLASEAPTLAIFIRTMGLGCEALTATLRSLRDLQPPYAPSSITVLGGPEPAAQEKLPQLRWVATEALEAIHPLVQMESCGWILMVDAGDCFTPSGLPMVALELRDAPQCRAVYADALARTDVGEPVPLMRPDFNLDMLLSCPANIARHWLFRRDVFLEAGGFEAAYTQAPEFALLLRLIETGGLDGLGHVHEPLLTIAAPPLENNAHELAALQRHLLARGYDNATVDTTLPGRYRILYGHAAQPLVSIIIPTRDQFALLERCVSSLLEKTAYPHYEILLVDNGSTEPAACAWLDGLAALGEARIRVLRYPQPFNYAAMNNLGAREARGDYLVLLNNDTAIVQGDWLDTLLNHAQRPEVGVVGAKLLYPSGQVQHAGLLLGLHGMAGYPFSGAEADAPGYMHRLEIDQNYSAVSAACLMVRRALYDELGGMDAEAFPLICGDMDLCLRARTAGYLTVWTPHAVLLHEKGATLAAVPPEAFAQQRERAQDAMYHRWLPALAHDPAYNRNLSLQSTEFAVETDTRLNWNPLPWRPLPVVLAVNADAFGCGHYRIIHPGHAMAQAGLADVRVSEYHYGPVEMERLRPDTWVLQRLVSDAPFEMARRTAPFTQAFKVAELDDYLLNLPMKNGHRGQLPQDMQRVLRRWLDLTDRLVVSTAPLAQAMAKLHRDIRVVPNRLPPERWGHLSSLRRQGRRPRVGWAGGASHQGDLELIADVVKALAGEVEWVFLGMCPAPMRPYLHEHHAPVDIASYPHKLASLNLDLAVAPLEHNLFNDCKSNLKLLEYGACGYPVVCSDVAAYQGSLPVTRVKNRYKDWVDAIRMHLADLDATAAAGDALRDAVRQNWMLEGAHLDDWLRAWLPG
ncbi:MAG: glycosyltransferase [Comamonadaceae bacterium]|nr:glycosyltransferase [Comamonadaceae bacterium]